MMRPFAISSNHYCAFAASKDGGRSLLYVASNCLRQHPRVDIDACGRNIVMKESQVSIHIEYRDVTMLLTYY
jgi:hypothetical protein